LCKPTAAISADLGAGIRKPARRQLLTGTAGREPATAVISAQRQLFIAMAMTTAMPDARTRSIVAAGSPQ